MIQLLKTLISIQKSSKYYHMSFFCCQTEEPEFKYEVNTLSQNGQPPVTKYYNSAEEIDHLVRENQKVSITKVRTQLGLSELQTQMKKNKQKFTDNTFPPQNSSLGPVQGNITWKRLPELLPKNTRQVLFDKKIEPSDVIAGHEGNCYLLSALAALAEYPDIIRRIFRGQIENEEGLYKVNLRVNGVVEEVIIDDFVPVKQKDIPLFCQPNKKTGQIWVPLLEKALAKVNGSYYNLNEGVPSDVFRTVTYAPSQSLVFSDDETEEEKVWKLLLEYTSNHYPFCATTKNTVNHGLGLKDSHTYTIIAAAQTHDQHGSGKQVKLRNPWQNTVVQVQKSHQVIYQQHHEGENRALAENNSCDYGLFFLSFQDFCKNFNQIHYCNLNSGGKYLSEPLLISNKACFFDVSLQRDGVYTFELSQAKINFSNPKSANIAQAHEPVVNFQQTYHHQNENIHEHQHENGYQHQQHELEHEHEREHEHKYEHNYQHEHEHEHKHEYNHQHGHPEDHRQSEHVNHGNRNQSNISEGLAEIAPRSTILLIKKIRSQSGIHFEYVAGAMRYNQLNTILTEQLTTGDYVVYCKVDPSFSSHQFPSSATLNLYSKNFASLKPVLRTTYPYLLRSTFMNHAQNNKKADYSEGKVWISWQLLLQKGGFAYLAAANRADNNQNIKINLKQEDFKEMGYKLKKPLKGRSDLTVVIAPGQSEIIVARVVNNPHLTSLKFPPKISIQLEQIHH